MVVKIGLEVVEPGRRIDGGVNQFINVKLFNRGYVATALLNLGDETLKKNLRSRNIVVTYWYIDGLGLVTADL